MKIVMCQNDRKEKQIQVETAPVDRWTSKVFVKMTCHLGEDGGAEHKFVLSMADSERQRYSGR